MRSFPTKGKKSRKPTLAPPRPPFIVQDSNGPIFKDVFRQALTFNPVASLWDHPLELFQRYKPLQKKACAGDQKALIHLIRDVPWILLADHHVPTARWLREQFVLLLTTARYSLDPRNARRAQQVLKGILPTGQRGKKPLPPHFAVRNCYRILLEVAQRLRNQCWEALGGRDFLSRFSSSFRGDRGIQGLKKYLKRLPPKRQARQPWEKIWRQIESHLRDPTTLRNPDINDLSLQELRLLLFEPHTLIQQKLATHLNISVDTLKSYLNKSRG